MEQTKKNITSLHPTQLTAGYSEVQEKERDLIKLMRSDSGIWDGVPFSYQESNPEHAIPLEHFLQKHPVPVVSWGGCLYIIDHHHLVLAAHHVGIEHVYVDVILHLGGSDTVSFWKEMERRHLVHPLDENGVRHSFQFLPGCIDGLRDDMYRSLAWKVRKNGGYEKTNEPFEEFAWADFFRRHIAIEDLALDAETQVKIAVSLARSHIAKHMPGYLGHKDK